MDRVMTKPLEKSFGILNPVFQGGDVLVICGSHDYWRKELKKRKLSDSEIREDRGGAVLEFQRDSFEMLVVLLPAASFAVDWYDSCAHEISHLVDRVLEKHWIKDTGGETRAYLTGFYTRAILGELCGIKPFTYVRKHFKKEKKK
jgi:hypothetical protein